jgi:hypothetical protein
VPLVIAVSCSFCAGGATEVIATVRCAVGEVRVRGRFAIVVAAISRVQKVDSIIAIAIERTAVVDPRST